jgi:hypothetical protein
MLAALLDQRQKSLIQTSYTVQMKGQHTTTRAGSEGRAIPKRDRKCGGCG